MSPQVSLIPPPTRRPLCYTLDNHTFTPIFEPSRLILPTGSPGHSRTTSISFVAAFHQHIAQLPEAAGGSDRPPHTRNSSQLVSVGLPQIWSCTHCGLPRIREVSRLIGSPNANPIDGKPMDLGRMLAGALTKVAPVQIRAALALAQVHTFEKGMWLSRRIILALVCQQYESTREGDRIGREHVARSQVDGRSVNAGISSRNSIGGMAGAQSLIRASAGRRAFPIGMRDNSQGMTMVPSAPLVATRRMIPASPNIR